ncbi:hypothetical protein CVT26_008651 [Gymnopilus dilepis]|uniref:Uncharacterized protein n=1 Tax=Gymnopilus dilepis TaxID=231916 RepID=A0A409XY12_9AGAR|nr:hypothetical protein CVT26_008651 [Gymnopilus dilepis]
MQSVATPHDSNTSNEPRLDQNPKRTHLSDNGLRLFDLLPAEVISIIFAYYIQDSSRISRDPFFALTLGRICRRWRKIAWATPNLWTSLSIGYKYGMNVAHTPVELAEEWLSRSGALPVSIQHTFDNFQSHFRYFENALRECQRMLKVYSRYSDRWGSLSLALPSAPIEGFTLPRTPSMLQGLTLHVYRDDYADLPEYPRITAFSKCSPKNVKLIAVEVDLNWTTATHLHLEFVDMAEVLRIFQKASKLSRCTLRDIPHYGTDVSTIIRHAPIICPVLECLDVAFAEEEAQIIFCRSITLPALKHLTIGSSEWDTSDLSVDELIFFLAQSPCTLETLGIETVVFERGTLLRLVPVLSSLTNLEISSGFSYRPEQQLTDLRNFCLLLAGPGGLPPHLLPFAHAATQPFLPVLENFLWDGYEAYPWETIPRLLKPAMPDDASYCRPLKSVKILCRYRGALEVQYIQEDVIQQLFEFKDVKFDFTVRSDDIGQESEIDWLQTSLEKIKRR